MTDLWRSLLTEFVGTFILVFVGAGSVALTLAQGGSLLGSALAFGLTLVVLIYTWGNYSGAHFNPAISFGAAVAGRMNWLLMLGYWIVQLLGGIAAAALIAYLFGTESGVGASIGSLTNTDAWRAVLLEAFLTFFLVVTFLFITGNPWMAFVSGLAIGLVLTFDMLVGAPLTGASMNPARSLGPAIFSNNLGTYWIYIVGPLLGALVAALVYKLYTTEWNCKTKKDECGNVIRDECGHVLKECKRPMVDACGKTIKDCNGKTVYETYTKRCHSMNHMQANPLTAAADWMKEQGFDPRYVKQELTHAAANGNIVDVAANPAVLQQNVPVINNTVPAVAVSPSMRPASFIPNTNLAPASFVPNNNLVPGTVLPSTVVQNSTLPTMASTSPLTNTVGNTLQSVSNPVSLMNGTLQNVGSVIPPSPRFQPL